MLTEAQLKKLKSLEEKRDVIESYETKGGLLAVRLRRHSHTLPEGIYYFGRRGGSVSYKLLRPDGSVAYKEDYD